MAAESTRQLQRLIRHAGLFTRPGTGATGGVTAATAAAAAATFLPKLKLSYGRSKRQLSDIAAATPAAESATASGAAAEQQQAQAGEVLKQTCKVAGKTWTFETGRLAGLAHGSCLVSVDGTSVLGTAVVDPTPQLEADGVPLQVEYRERLSAAGRLPMRPDRRERVGSERELLVARLIDRAVRPLLPPGFLYDTQVWVQVLSADGSIDPEVVAINAASAALLLAPSIPFTHPVGGVKVRRVRKAQDWKGHKLTINSAVDEVYSRNSIAGGATSSTAVTATSTSNNNGNTSVVNMSLTYAGSPDKATAIEATGQQTDEAAFVAAMRLAAVSTKPLIQAQQALEAAVLTQQQEQQQRHLAQLWPSQQLQQTVGQLTEQPLKALFTKHKLGSNDCSNGGSSSSTSSDKESRAAALSSIQSGLLRDLQRMGLLAEAGQLTAAAGQVSREDALRAFDVLQSRVMREVLLESEASRRVDGRALDDLRPISCEAGPLARTVHGSGLFTRGETQSLATATVGHDTEVAPMESLFSRQGSTNLHLHYSFPPYSVGEVGKQGMPNRREIGHGNLARSGVLGLMPSVEDFPFSVRVTADTLSSSGSSSMAAVCAASLALKTAGVPVAALAAGISVGLVSAAPPQLGSTVSVDDSNSQDHHHHQQQQQQDTTAGLDPGSYSSFVAAGWKSQQTQADGSGSSSSSSGSDSDSCSSSSSSSSSSEGDAAAGSSKAVGRQVHESSYGPALLLTDIQGIEDHLGDMDFKIAGTKIGLTAVQLDTKLPGVDLHLLEAALKPAAAARHTILTAMDSALKTYESSTPSIDHPQYGAVQIMKELVPRLIGPHGSTLRDIEEGCGASLIVDDGGTINVYAPTQLRFQHALAAVQEVEGRGAKKGEVYRVRVLRVVDFGAYVALPNGLPALLHVSELSHEKIREVRDVVAEGQEFDVVCKGRDSKGFVLLSLKDLLPNPHAQQGQGESGSSRESAMAAAISLQDKLAAAVAAAAAGAVDDSSGSSSSHCSSGGSIGRFTQQHHVHHSIKPAASSSSSSGSSNNGGKSWRPRAMTWRPPAAAQQPFRPAQQQPSVQSEEQQ